MSEEKKYLYTTWFGSFILKDGEILEKKLFPEDAEEIAEKKYKKENGEILEEEKKLASEIEDELFVTSKRLSVFGDVIDSQDFSGGLEEYSHDDELLQESLQKLGMIKIRDSIDFGEHLAKAVDTIQDLNESINLKMERLRDWYSLHFPELEKEMPDRKYLELISEYGERDKIEEQIDTEGEPMGQDVTPEEVKHFKRLAGLIKEEMEYREELEDYVENRMKEYAPNLTTLTGPKLGGELIAKTGSLEELAKQPASTIQMLGAEKSLFKHLDKGTPPPKHGLILQHPYVHRAPESLRGKIARTFANKIAIASRIDYFDGDYRGEKMREELEEKIEKIKKEN